jgi:hypothetical protein
MDVEKSRKITGKKMGVAGENGCNYCNNLRMRRKGWTPQRGQRKIAEAARDSIPVAQCRLGAQGETSLFRKKQK